MKSPPSTLSIHTAWRQAATQRAHALRNQAIDEALRLLGRWLRRPFARPARLNTLEQPCHS